MSLIRYFPIFLFCALTPVSIETQEVPRMGELSLVPGDILRVLVWREEDLSGDFQVDQDGKIILPLLGEVPVDDKKWDEVRDWLLQEYRKELRNPSIELTPFRSVYVLGEVTLPGRYNVHPTNDNLAGAVSLAGGVTPDGDIRNLRIVRDGVIVGGSKLVVQNDKLKDIKIEKPLPLLDLSKYKVDTSCQELLAELTRLSIKKKK